MIDIKAIRNEADAQTHGIGLHCMRATTVLALCEEIERLRKDAEKYRLRVALAQVAIEQQPECSTHPDAPHGFDRNRSHSLGRYVCDCEGWMP